MGSFEALCRRGDACSGPPGLAGQAHTAWYAPAFGIFPGRRSFVREAALRNTGRSNHGRFKTDLGQLEADSQSTQLALRLRPFLPSAAHRARHMQLVSWSFTMPTACMNA
jgi:hypothetical protein